MPKSLEVENHLSDRFLKTIFDTIMELKEILSISGAPGLFKYIAQGKGGIIVESLTDKRRTMVSGSTKVSTLSDISVFTQSDEVSLGDVLQSVYDKNAGKPIALVAKPSPAELQSFMVSVLPEYDKDRVHNSDIKKIAQWYNALIAVGVTSFKETEVVEGDDSVAELADKTKSTAAKKPAATNRSAAPKAASRSKAPASRSTTVRKAQ